MPQCVPSSCFFRTEYVSIVVVFLLFCLIPFHTLHVRGILSIFPKSQTLQAYFFHWVYCLSFTSEERYTPIALRTSLFLYLQVDANSSQLVYCVHGFCVKMLCYITPQICELLYLAYFFVVDVYVELDRVSFAAYTILHRSEKIFQHFPFKNEKFASVGISPRVLHYLFIINYFMGYYLPVVQVKRHVTIWTVKRLRELASPKRQISRTEKQS